MCILLIVITSIVFTFCLLANSFEMWYNIK
nr:MAG TPA: apelin receptor protein [Bacteriophage sp.]